MSVHSDDGSANRNWPVTRGDDEVMLLCFFDAYYGEDHPDNVPSDLTGFEYISSVSTGRETDHILMVTPTPSFTDNDPTLGELLLSVTDIQTNALPKSTYVWDCVENPGTTTETTLIGGRMTVSGRATP